MQHHLFPKPPFLPWLQSYRHLLYYYSTCCTSTSTNDSYANYLVHSLGFSRQQALSISAKLSLRRNKAYDSEFADNANSVVTLFRSLGFHQTHISNIVSKVPHLLASNVNKTLKPKIRALQDEDFSRSDIVCVISRRPTMLWFGLETRILPTIHILRQVMGSVANVVKALEKINDLYFRNIVKFLLPNIAFLSVSHGVPIELIRKQLLYQPAFFVRNPKVFKDISTRIDKKLGVTRHSPMNLYGINLISGMSVETFESKCQIFKSFGANQSLSNYLAYHVGFRQQAPSACTNDSCANYLVHFLGFSHQQDLSITAKLSRKRKFKVIDSKFVDNANSVVTLFHNLGFHQTLIQTIVSRVPRLLVSNVKLRLKPKLRALQDADLSETDIIRVISRHPKLLLYGLEPTILPVIHILKQVMGSISNAVIAIERLGEWHFRTIVRCLLPNVALLSSYGVPIELIRKQFLCQPGYFAQNPEAFKNLVTGADQMLGITPHSPMFLDGIKFISGISKEPFQSNYRIFKSFGWTQRDIETFILKHWRRFPFSDESITKKLDYLMNEMQLKPAVITSQSGFISCSLEKRILPRYKILQILKEIGFVDKNLSLYTVNQLSERCFLERFVLPFIEVHEAYAKLTSCTVEILTQESSVSLSKN